MIKILIAGGSGLVGQRLCAYLPKDRYKINILSRSSRKNHDNVSYFKWDTNNQTIDSEALTGIDAIINLAGVGIADKRWTANRKKLIVESRTASIETLGIAVRALGISPVYIGASAIGYYGNRGDKIMNEGSDAGTGFLSEVTQTWEASNLAITSLFDRQVLLRIGIVLSTKGGAMKEMLKPTVARMFGYFGDGSAYYSWIHIDDLCEMIKVSIEEKHDGIYNATAPNPVTVKQLMVALKKAKGVAGIVMPVPTIALKVALGEMSQMLTDSMRVVPARFTKEGFSFGHNRLVDAMKHILNNKI